MPQQTNLNVEPYFDDFNSLNDYHRVLFKPGYPVQARELTTLQSIMQDQIEKFGQHFFKEGSKVIPGNTGYSQLYYCVQINATYLGVPVSAYIDQVVGSRITGLTSGVSAYVDFVLPADQSERGLLTLYVNYLSSSTQNNSTQTFSDGEELVSDDVLTSTLFANPFVQQGSPFATTISNDAAATGSVFQIESGVYFVRGNFVAVDKEYLILDQYSDRPNYRVGLLISEEIVTADIDESLNDNSQGFNNYSSPGADRLKITASLFKKGLDDLDDTNFIELAIVENGILKVNSNISTSGTGIRDGISDAVANRSFIQSGNFYTKPFEVSVEDSLDNKIGNRGLFDVDQFTPSGGSPSEDLAIYKVSPGKAIVRGFEVETTSPVMIDVQKPRVGKSLTDQLISFNTGSTLIIKKLYGLPTIGIGNGYHVSLRNAVVASSTGEAGIEIGVARVYDFRLTSSTYNANSDDNEWGISLYDIDIFSTATLSSSVTYDTPTFIRGSNSGATAFLRDSVSSSSSITVYGIKGTFEDGEKLYFDGLESDITISSITNYGLSEVKSLLSKDGATVDFSCDLVKVSDSSEDSLYTELTKKNISSVNLEDSSITIRKTYTVNITNNTVETNTTPTAGTNEVFLQFNPERYSLVRSDGTTEQLDFSKLQLSLDSKSLIFSNLGSDDVGATLIATLEKTAPTSKAKILNRVDSIVIDKTKLSHAPNNLDYNTYPFGTRVEDEIISLNKPDIVEIHGVFESASSTVNASCPMISLITLSTQSSTTSELIAGETIVGQISGAVAILAEKLTNPTDISILYKNDTKFRIGEQVIFSDSDHTAVVNNVVAESFDISSNYTYSSGQEKTFYNYGTIKRKTDANSPSKRLKIYYSVGYHDSTDDGDITTVNSYQTFNYGSEIPSIDGIRNTDIIDIRPRVSDFTYDETSERSPLEFFGRSFSQQGNTAKNILASGEQISIDLAYYRGRIDSIFLTKTGKMQVKYGVPSDNPERPDQVDGTLEIATINMPPYLYDTEDSSITISENKRYTMSDIKKLEDRIESLEKYTTLSVLETKAANLFVEDSTGQDRFKSGFFVDDFTTFKSQDDSIPINNSIDESCNELRPSHYTTSVDFIPGPVTGIAPGEDLSLSEIEGVNIKRENNIVTLDYSDVEWLSQMFATRTESVTPFITNFWQGFVDITPSSSSWVDIRKNGSVDTQDGFEPNIWNSWQKNWIGVSQNYSLNEYSAAKYKNSSITQEEGKATVGINNHVNTLKPNPGSGHRVQDKIIKKISLSTKSKNIHFEAKNIKPGTRMYAFFDGKDVSKYCVPKMLEISMLNGTFEVGETVDGIMISNGLDQKTSESARISFRVAKANHKEGPYNAPTKLYAEDPYNVRIIPDNYSSTSTILNVDTVSLSNYAEVGYHGWVEVGMLLTGRDSGAQATILSTSLVSDATTCLTGSFYIPDSSRSINPKFESGEKVFTLNSDEDNDENISTSVAETSYFSSGILETVYDDMVSIRNPISQNRHEFIESLVRNGIDTEVTSGASNKTSLENTVAWCDPLAQVFKVEDDHGIFATRCDVYFRTKDVTGIPVEIQIRPMKNGVPSDKIVPGSRIALNPAEIQTSSDGSLATTFEFGSPVYLEGSNTEYAVCLKSSSTKYSVYISKIGEFDILSDSYISNLSYLGPLFKSQNTSSWEPSLLENLKFSIYRADFLESGSVEFYNKELASSKLMPDSLSFSSRKIKVTLTAAITALSPGTVLTQDNTNATAIVTKSTTTELTLDNVQGEFLQNNTDKLIYTPVGGSATDLVDGSSNLVYPSAINITDDGLHVKINHKNHGMHSTNNKVKLSKVSSDIKATKLSVLYPTGSTISISLDDASEFSTFENVPVGTNNTGFIIIEDEIIEYTGVTGNQLTGITRGIDNTSSRTYPFGTPVYKYEVNGINLRRINKTHDIAISETTPVTFDSYYIKLDMSEVFNSNNDPRDDDLISAKLFAKETKTCGGYLAEAAYNIPFEIITPNIHNLTVDGTNISAQIRTTTGQSLSDEEVPFLNTGFEEVSINKTNYLNSPRIICSKVNEDARMSANPGSKSANLRLFLSTTNSKLSPVIDAERVSMILTSTRINSIIENYATDDRANQLFTDPTACQYVSKEMNIESSAKAIKILLNAELTQGTEIRAFYATSPNKGFDPVFTPFPGKGSAKDGTPDKTVAKSLGYKEYEFTTPELSEFKSYKIKIILTSKSQVNIPRIRDLKVIALA